MTSGPDEIKSQEQEGAERESFFSRWSRRKEEALRLPPEPAPDKNAADTESPAPELPPVEQLTPASDYRAFFHPKVSEDVRRAALKKLFSDPHFNVMDGLDVYIDDYSKTEPIPAAMLAGLKQAQNILRWAKEDEEERAQNKVEQKASAPVLERPASQSAPDGGVGASAPDATPASPGGSADRVKS